MSGPQDGVFLIAVAIMFGVTLSCRVGGLLLGAFAADNARLRRILDILPTCAIGAVIGPLALRANVVEAAALAIAALLFILTNRFLPSLLAGFVVLAAGPWAASAF